MLRSSSSSTLLLSALLALAASTVACTGKTSDNSDVDSALQAVKKKDGRPTGDGKSCSWSGVNNVEPPVSTPPSSGSSGGCSVDADGKQHCWSYDANGNQKDLPTKEGSSSGWSGSSTSSSGANGGGGSSGGCSTDEQGHTTCWSYGGAPAPEPAPMPAPEPSPSPEYQIGDWFPALDGCNKCTCTDIGIMCTVQACSAPPPPPSCEYNGRKLGAGEGFMSSDGCNRCSCGPDGQVACTAMYCPTEVPPSPPKGCEVSGKWIPSGTSYSDGCNTCTCDNGQTACTKMACEDPVPPQK